MQVNQKAAESLADPTEYPNLFEDWQVALAVESKVSETRYSCLYFFPFFLPNSGLSNLLFGIYMYYVSVIILT